MLEISTWSHITQIAMTFKKQYMIFCNVILKYIFGHSLLYYDSDVLFQVIWTQSPVTYCWQFLSYRITSDWWVTMEHKQNNCLIPTILLKFKNLSQKKIDCIFQQWIKMKSSITIIICFCFLSLVGALQECCVLWTWGHREDLPGPQNGSFCGSKYFELCY